MVMLRPGKEERVDGDVADGSHDGKQNEKKIGWC